MKSRLLSLVLVLVAVLLGACASGPKMNLDGSCVDSQTVWDTLDRSGTYFGEYKNCVKDASGKIVSGTRVGPFQLSISSTVAGQTIAGAFGGTVPALINYKTATAVAEKGKCGDGAICGPVYNNQVQSLAESLNTNTSNLTVSGACSTGTCK